MAQRNIAVLGAGNVGGTLARLWAAQGHTVRFGVRDPQSDKVQEMVAALRGKGSAAQNHEAVASADIVALCVPWPNAEDAIRASGNMAGKILIDCTNPLSSDLKGLTIGLATSAAEQVARWARGAQVVKAFNTIGAGNFGNAEFGGLRADGFYCGDDRDAKKVVRELIEDVGLEPVDVGPLSNARWLEPLAMLWIDLAFNQKQGTNHAFKLLRR